MSTDPWVWIAAALTLCIFSFLYKDNPFYKFAEHLMVGISSGYLIAVTWRDGIMPNLIVPLQNGRLHFIIPGILGIFMFLRFFPKLGWLSRWSLAFMIGLSAGTSIPPGIQARFLAQMSDAMLPLYVSGDIWASITNILLVGGTICCLIYFFFSKEHTGLFGKASKVGIWFLMIGFGASFGYTVMARISLLIGRVLFILRDWLGFIS